MPELFPYATAGPIPAIRAVQYAPHAASPTLTTAHHCTSGTPVTCAGVVRSDCAGLDGSAEVSQDSGAARG